MSESAAKISIVRAWLKANKLEGAVFATRANAAWLSGGADTHVVSQSGDAFAAMVVTPRQAYLLANTIEMPRITAEEPVGGFTAKSFPWIQPLSEVVSKIAGDKKKSWVSDHPAATGLKDLPADFAQVCRAQLSEPEMRRYKALGRDCALVIETVARQLNLGDSEHQAEADLGRHLLARGIQPHVLLVAFDQRILKYRHPTPGQNHLRKLGMLVVCGQRHGLIASLTRLFHFGPLPKELAAKHEAVCRVEAALWEATVPGVAYGKVLAKGLEQYTKEGFPKEWELHHQGGPTGYAGRDYCVVPDEKRPVLDRQAVAWNPSITGTKTEDTFLLEGGKRTVVTACSPVWPTVTVATPKGEKLVRPAILVR
jgi:Xaa-Pro dipeptidase